MPRISDQIYAHQPFSSRRGALLFRLLTGMLLPLLLAVPAVQVHADPLHRSAPSGAVPSVRAAIHHLLGAINRDREAHHLSLLMLSRQQSRCSIAHSRQMARDGTLSHDQFPADICVPHGMSAENVGYYTAGPAVAVRQLHSMMMSEGPCPQPGCPGDEWFAHDHYVNLMNPDYHRVGIGVVVQGGTTWLTEDFTD